MFLITDAYAQGAASSEPSLSPLFLIGLMLLAFFFLVMRPQSKRQKEVKAMIDALAKGDEIVTSGGMVGRVTDLSDQYITLQVSSIGDKPVTISVQRSSVQVLLPKGTMKSI